MTTIPKEYSRLALISVLIAYSVLVIGTCLKVRMGMVPPDAFAFTVRDYGFWLLLLPACWGAWAVVATTRDPDVHVQLDVLIGGYLVAIILFSIAAGATTSALRRYPASAFPSSTPKPAIIRHLSDAP